jgi:hypothetical protein
MFAEVLNMIVLPAVHSKTAAMVTVKHV